MDSGVARRPIKDFDAYKRELSARLDPAANSTPFTVDLPASPSDGDKYSFRISKLSCNVGFQSTDGSTVDDGSSGFGFSPVQSASFLYRSANTTWYRGN